MKYFLLSLIGVALSGVSLAYPAIGDHVVYNNLIGGGTIQFNNNGFDDQENVWIILYQDATSMGEQYWTNDQIVHKTDIDKLFANCAADGGTMTSITVPAGTFNTCKITGNDGGTTWFGDVPFGLLKIDSSTIKIELVKFESGS